jgi:hypothetical protein
MALFPQIGPEYLSEEDRGIKERMEAFYAESISINQSFWAEADTDTRFEAGDQTLWTEIYNAMPYNRRNHFNFNRIRRVVNMISGHQRRNRKSTIVTGVDNADEMTADQFSKIIMWINQQEHVLETISDSFQGSLVTGMNLLQVWVDYRSDPVSGNIKVDNCSYNSFLIDPFFRKADLSDCNGLWKRSFLTKKEAISLLPDHKNEIMQLQGQGARDNKFEFMPENTSTGVKSLLTYDEYHYRDYRSQRILIDSQTGETLEWKSEDEESLKRFLSLYPQITVSEHEIPTVRVAILVQGKVFYDGPNPIGIDSYPFVPVFAYYTPQIPYFPWRVQGVVRGLRDAQFLFNRRKIIELDILESQINSGWKYKENALVDPKDVFLSGQGRGLALKTEAQMTDVEQIIPPQIPPSMIELSKLLADEIQEISGINEELLGSATDDKAGILSMLRQGAGLTTLQVLFDRLDMSQKLLGKLMIDIIQANFTPGKVKRIIEEEPAPQFYNKAFGKYDAAVEEGLNTTTQKQLQFAQLLQMREAGVTVPDSVLLEASTMQNKKDLMQAVEAQNQAQQQAQEEERQATMQEQAARAELAQARAIADRGLGLERASRVAENEAMAIGNMYEAEKDKYAGYLSIVKALKELEGMDLESMQKLVEISRMIKENETLTQGPKGLEQKEQQKTKQYMAALGGQTGDMSRVPVKEGQAGPKGFL